MWSGAVLSGGRSARLVACMFVRSCAMSKIVGSSISGDSFRPFSMSAGFNRQSRLCIRIWSATRLTRSRMPIVPMRRIPSLRSTLMRRTIRRRRSPPSLSAASARGSCNLAPSDYLTLRGPLALGCRYTLRLLSSRTRSISLDFCARCCCLSWCMSVFSSLLIL